MAQRLLFTSESVTEGHPDKIADQISDSILDAILEQDPMGRVACETMVTTGQAHIAGEISTSCYVDISKIVRETIRNIGYTRAKFGFDADTCGILISLDEQSPDIAQGVDKACRYGEGRTGPEHQTEHRVFQNNAALHRAADDSRRRFLLRLGVVLRGVFGSGR